MGDCTLPRINNRLINSVVFIYGTEEQTYAGALVGATGFLTAVPFKLNLTGTSYAHLYLVTNSHVADQDQPVAYQAPPITEPIGDGMKKWQVVVQSYPQSGLALLGITWGHMNGREPSKVRG